MRLHLKEPLEVNAKRVWEKPLVGGMNVYGVQFVGLEGEGLASLQKFLAEKLQENRRKSFRLERILVVEMQVEGRSSRFGVFTLDLSTSGMRINHEGPLPEGKDLELKLLLEPGHPPVEVKSEVSWQKENAFGHYLIGLRFSELSEEAEQRIENYIRQAIDRGQPKNGGLSSFLPPA